MSDLLDEHVPRMPPVSIAALEQVAERTLELLDPAALQEPRAVDWRALVDTVLQQFKIFIYPAHSDQLEDRLAFTDSSGATGDDINILLSFDLWNDLVAGGRLANRAHATVAHELAHAILHVPVIRRRAVLPNADLLLNRVRREEIKAFEDPEWQAWALAGCVLAPRKTLEMLSTSSIAVAADIYGVSEAMLRSHLKRLKLLRRFT